jgi:hypothetical protein
LSILKSFPSPGLVFGDVLIIPPPFFTAHLHLQQLMSITLATFGRSFRMGPVGHYQEQFAPFAGSAWGLVMETISAQCTANSVISRAVSSAWTPVRQVVLVT